MPVVAIRDAELRVRVDSRGNRDALRLGRDRHVDQRQSEASDDNEFELLNAPSTVSKGRGQNNLNNYGAARGGRGWSEATHKKLRLIWPRP